MTGAKLIITLDDKGALAPLREMLAALDDDTPLLRSIGEYGLQSTQQRFVTQTDPNGAAWAPLSPAYLRRKRRNADKILTLRGHLRGTLAYQVASHAVLIGSPRTYAAIHQLGGDINIAARSQHAFFRQGADGAVGRLFVKESKSNFAQRISIAAYTFRMKARPFLGVSAADRDAILALAQRHLTGD